MLKIDAPSSFVVQIIDGEVGRGGQFHEDPPVVVAVASCLEDAFIILRELGEEKRGVVLEVVNPLRIAGRLTRISPKVHRIPLPPQQKVVRSAKAKKH